jgi:catechol 2,3-dioxygenase-like lactoylglutathione lyase family enzyme
LVPSFYRRGRAAPVIGGIMPNLNGILETVIHTKDMPRARAFYESVLGLALIYSDDRLSAYAVAGRDVLLVFRKGAAAQTVTLPSGTIPGHGGDGTLHVAFAISKDDLDRWEAHLASRGVVIEGRNDWERGGRSVYFRDPDGHLLELATPGLWSVY